MDFLKIARGQWDRVLAWGLTVFGAVALVVGWFGVSRSGLPAEQFPYLISGGLGGLLLVAVGATLWLSADLHDEWRKLDQLNDEVKRLGRVAQPEDRQFANGVLAGSSGDRREDVVP